MAVVEQERRSVLLRRDRVVGALVDDLEVAHAELVADRRARVGAHRAGHDQRRLLRQVIGEREHLGRHLGLRHHALDGAGAVAHLEEVQLPARAPSRQPPVQRDRPPRVRADPLDRRRLRHASPRHSRRAPAKLVAGGRGRLESAAGGTAMLGFRLNEEQESFRAAVRSFAEKALAPRVEELERTETFPMDLFRELGRLGYLGVGYPEEYGGSGGDMVMRCLLIEEIARVNCGFAAALLAHVGLGCIPIFRFGTEEQKRQYLVPAIRGEKLGAFGLSEPNSGSDAASIRTRAERKGDVYVINGAKMFITNGNIADYCLVAAYTDPSRRGAGISMFIVDTKVPASALLGGVEGGFKQVTGTLEGGRITHSARSVGVSQAALEAAVKYAKEREQFGQPIVKFQAIKFKLARMAMEVETARTSMWRAAWLFDQGYCMREAAMAKLYASEVAQRVTWEAVQIFGGYGYITEFPVERFWRDARLMTITEGTTEIQLTIIARELGL